MAKHSKNQSNVTHVTGTAEYRQRDRELRQQNYDICSPDLEKSFIPEAGDVTWNDYIHSQLRSGEKTDGKQQRHAVPTLYFSTGNEQTTGAEKIGTPGLGWIEWGDGNLLPNVVALLTHMLPYTSAAVKFNTDLCAGIGPQPMYDTSTFVAGNITNKAVRFKDAGTYLRGLLVDKRRELLNMQKDYRTAVSGGASADKELEQSYKELVDACRKQIKQLEDDLTEWELTMPEVEDFIASNNLTQTWLALALDQVLFGVCFPELQLNQQDVENGKPVPTARWNPRITGISHHTCHTTRFERMDETGRINYIYCSQRWLDKPYLDQGGETNAPIYAIPVLDPKHPWPSLEKSLVEARTKNVSVARRPTRFVMPSVYPTAGRPYYPTAVWHSIFGGDIYEYLATCISDRLQRKKNSNIIGRIIYVHNDYLQQIFMQGKATGDPAKQKQIRDKFYDQINQWLANRDNAGRSLLAFTFMGNDGKEHKSFEVVEVESSSSDVAANEKETAELASIVFMSFGLDSKLLGSSPLSIVNSSGGTDLRERYLLRLIMMSTTQAIMLKPLEVITRHNQWDKHLFWQIPREVMTTLDNSKTGVTADNE